MQVYRLARAIEADRAGDALMIYGAVKAAVAGDREFLYDLVSKLEGKRAATMMRWWAKVHETADAGLGG